MKLRSSAVEETRDIGERLASLMLPGDVIVLSGDLGSGKTALAQGIGRGLGVEGPVVSPTFVIVREHAGPLPMAHVDVYRLDHVQELHDLGFEEVLDAGRVTVIEWGERVAPLLPESRLEVSLRTGPTPAEREIECAARGWTWVGRERNLEEALAPWAVDTSC